MGYLKNKTFGFYLSFVAAILAAAAAKIQYINFPA
jgi:hypothetical protein